MAFDYCSASEAFAYGASAGNSVDPVDEAAVMAEIVTAASRAVDTYCQQEFSTTAYTLRRLRAKVDADGILTVAVPAPTITALTAMEYRPAGAADWLSSGGTLDAEEHTHGAIVRALGVSFLAYRARRVDVRLTYTGGYANAAAMPDDLRWATRAAAWYEFQRRSAPMDRTAMPSMGIVVIPGDWPKHITERLRRYVRVTAS